MFVEQRSLEDRDRVFLLAKGQICFLTGMITITFPPSGTKLDMFVRGSLKNLEFPKLRIPQLWH